MKKLAYFFVIFIISLSLSAPAFAQHARPTRLFYDEDNFGESFSDFSLELFYEDAYYIRLNAKAADWSSAAQSITPQSVTPFPPAPNDPYYSSQTIWGNANGYMYDMWGLHNLTIVWPGDPQHQAIYRLLPNEDENYMQEAWKLSTGTGVTVAVVDTGVDYNHPDINDNIWTNTGEIPGNGIDDDHNGFVDDIHGWNFTIDPAINPQDGPKVMDAYGHGTHVAGIIAAEGNNGEGTIGVAYNAKIMPLKVFVNATAGKDFADAIRYATDNGAKVINCSWGIADDGGYPYMSDLISAIKYAYDHGVIIVAAAGNDYGPIAGYPALSPYVITVGSIDSQDDVAQYSNYGPTLDVVAPGGEGSTSFDGILSLRAAGTTIPGGVLPGGDQNSQYILLSGTSMAAPFVAGLAALILSEDPDMTFEDFKTRLKFSSYDIYIPGDSRFTLGWDPYSGWGMVDAFKALSYDWYTSGAVKTYWLLNPDAYNVIRYDYYEAGNTESKKFASPDAYNVIQYDYYESGNLQSKWLYTPDLDNVIRYSFYPTNLLETRYLYSPDASDNVQYGYYNESYTGGIGRTYLAESSTGIQDYNYAFIYGTDNPLLKYDTELFSTFGAGTEFLYYNTGLDDIISSRITFDNGNIAEVNYLPGGQVRLTEFAYGTTTGATAWFLWGTDVYGSHDNVVIEHAVKYTAKDVKQPGYIPSSVVISPDLTRAYVLSAQNNSYVSEVTVMDYETNTIETVIPLPSNYRSVFELLSPNGQYLYVLNNYNLIGSYDTISVINTSTNAITANITGLSGLDYGVFSADGAYLYVANKYSNTVSIINASTNSIVATIPVSVHYYDPIFRIWMDSPISPTCLTITPDGRYLYATSNIYGKSGIAIIDLSTKTIIYSSQLSPNAVLFRPDGKYAYLETNSGYIYIMNTTTYATTSFATGGSNHMVMSPDGQYIYAASGDNKTVTVINTATNSIEAVIGGVNNAYWISITPDGRYLYCGTDSVNPGMTVINTTTRAIEKTVEIGTSSNFAVISPDGKYIYTTFNYSGSMLRMNVADLWLAYAGFDPDTVNPANVLDQSAWQFIGEITDPATIQGILPELADWWQSFKNSDTVPEFPAISSDITKDGQGRVTERYDHNPYMNTTNNYVWDYQVSGQMKWDMLYDYDGDLSLNLVSSKVFLNQSDYDISHIDNWRLLSDTNNLSGTTKLYYETDGYLESKAFITPDANNNTYYHYIDEDFNSTGYGRVDKEVSAVADSDGATAYTFQYFGMGGNTLISSNTTWLGGTYLGSVRVANNTTLSITGDTYLDGGIAGGAGSSVTLVNGDLSLAFLSTDTLTIGAGFTLTIQAIPGGPQASGGGSQGSPSGTIAIKDLYSDSDCTQLIGTASYYTSGRIASKTLIYHDAAGNTYYHYRNEDFNSTGYGRVDRNVSATADADGAFSYKYTYYGFTDVVHYKYSYGNSDFTGLIGMHEYNTSGGEISRTSYYSSGRISSKTLTAPDANNNTYYHYLDEDFNSTGYGRVDMKVSATADTDGALSYKYMYYGSTDVIHLKYSYANADFTGPVVTYEYNTNGGEISRTSYYTSGCIASKTLTAPDANNNTYYHYLDEDFNSTGYGRVDKQVLAAPDADGAIAYVNHYFGMGGDTLISSSTTWLGGTYDFGSVTITGAATLFITGDAYAAGTSIAGGSDSSITIENGNLDVASINIGTVTIGAGCTVTMAAIPGGPLASGTEPQIDLSGTVAERDLYSDSDFTQLIGTASYYTSGRISSKTLTAPDANNNTYYHYIDEDRPGQIHGRVDRQVSATADADGAFSYKYTYYGSTDVIHFKYSYGNADFTGLKVTYEYNTSGAEICRTHAEMVRGDAEVGARGDTEANIPKPGQEIIPSVSTNGHNTLT